MSSLLDLKCLSLCTPRSLTASFRTRYFTENTFTEGIFAILINDDDNNNNNNNNNKKIIIIIIIALHWSFEERAKKKGLLNDLEPFKMPERVC